MFEEKNNQTMKQPSASSVPVHHFCDVQHFNGNNLKYLKENFGMTPNNWAFWTAGSISKGRLGFGTDNDLGTTNKTKGYIIGADVNELAPIKNFNSCKQLIWYDKLNI